MIQMCNNLVDLSMSSLVDVLSVVLFALRLFQYDGCALSLLLWITQNLLKKKKTRHRRRNCNSTKWYLSIKWEKEKPWQQAHASIPLLPPGVCVHQYFSKWSEYLRKKQSKERVVSRFGQICCQIVRGKMHRLWSKWKPTWAIQETSHHSDTASPASKMQCSEALIKIIMSDLINNQLDLIIDDQNDQTKACHLVRSKSGYGQGWS